jgi:Chitin binding Peritrophin-A domain
MSANKRSLQILVPFQPCINGRPDAYIPCAAIDPTKPICSSGVCSASAPGCSIPERPSNIVCTGVGLYPDPANCARYHSCPAVSTNSQVLDCPPPLLYDSLIEMCAPVPTPATCDYRCSTTQEMFRVYQPNPRYYVYCRPDASGAFTVNARVLRCPEGHVYRGGTCSFLCTAEGRFPDPSDPTRYYECFAMPGGTFLAQKVQCPVGMIVSNGLCVVE